MARLPQVPRRLAVTPQVESSISGADVARPYQMVAQALGQIGGAFQDKADADASMEGANAVTRDADGKLSVTPRSNLTSGGRNYNRALMQNYVARMGVDIRSAGNELQNEARGDPAVFEKGWNEFRRNAVRNAPPETRGAIETLIEQEGQRLYDGVVTQKRNSDLKAFEGSIKAEISLLDDELAALARQAGTDTPDYLEKRAQFQDLYGELAANPDFDVNPQEVEIALKRAESRHMAEGLVGTVHRIYETKGMAAAEKAADALLADPELKLSPAERRQYSNIAVADLRAVESERKAELRAFRPLASEIERRLGEGIDIDGSDVDEAIATLTEFGDPVRAMQLMRARSRARFLGEFSQLPDAQQLDLAQADGGIDAYVAKTVGAESAGNRFADNPDSTALGPGQFIESTWAEFIRERHPELAAEGGDIQKLRTDDGLSREAIEWYAGKNAAVLTDAGQPVTAGTLHLAHFLGTAGAPAMLAAPPDVSAASINPGAAAVNPTVFYNKGADGKPDLNSPKTAGEIVAWANRKMGSTGVDREMLVAMRTEITQDAKDHWEGIKAGFERGMPPSAGEIGIFARQIAIVDDADFREEVAAELSGYEGGYLLSSLPPAEGEQAVAAIRAGAGEDGFDELERETVAAMETAQKQSAAAIKADPIGHGQARGVIDVPPPLDFSTPEAVAAGMALREKNAGVLRETFRTPDVPVFRPAETDAVAAAIAGQPQQAAVALNAIANVSDDSLTATLGQEPIKSAIVGAVRGNDPEKFQSAMTALDQLWARAPQTLEKSFGADVIDTLQDWQAMLRYYPMDRLTETLKSREEPAVRERRERLETKGEESARKKAIGEIVPAFDSRFLQVGSIAPLDPLSRDAFLGDYETLYGQRYAATLDEGLAHKQTVERMRGVWTRSEVNGGQLTLHAPESVYMPVDGSYAWMREALKAELTTFGNAPSDFRVVADRTTDADIQNGGKPSYLVAVMNDATGEWDLVRNADATPLRYSFDDTRARADASERFATERARIFGGAYSPLGRGAYVR